MNKFFELMVSLLFVVFIVTVFTFSILLGIESRYDFIVGPAIYPIVIGSILLILGILWLVRSFKMEPLSSFTSRIKEVKNNGELQEEKIKHFLIILVSVSVYMFLLIPYLGFVISSILFVAFISIVHGGMKLQHGIAYSFILIGFIYVFLHMFIRMPLP